MLSQDSLEKDEHSWNQHFDEIHDTGNQAFIQLGSTNYAFEYTQYTIKFHVLTQHMTFYFFEDVKHYFTMATTAHMEIYQKLATCHHSQCPKSQENLSQLAFSIQLAWLFQS